MTWSLSMCPGISRQSLAAILAVLVCGVVGCVPTQKQSPELEMKAGQRPWKTIANAAEFRELLLNSHAILHIDVDWSFQAIESRPVVAEFGTAIGREPRLNQMVLRRLDLSGQEGELWSCVEDWLRSQKEDWHVMSAGYGAVVWVKDGKVVDSIHDAHAEGARKLLARTRRVFAE